MMTRTQYTVCATAVALVSVGAQAFGSTVYSQNTGLIANTTSTGFNNSQGNLHWYLNEVSLAGTNRFSPTITLDLYDSIVGSRDVTMHLFTGDGADTAPAAGSTDLASAIASLTVSTSDLGHSLETATTVSWTFDGVTLPDNLVIAIDMADTDANPDSVIHVSLFINPAVTVEVGTNHGVNDSANEGGSWILHPNNDTGLGFVNFTIDAQAITAVPLPSAAFLGAAGLLGLAARRRRAAVN